MGVVTTLIKILVVVLVIQGVVAYLVLLERKLSAFLQDRLGPNRVGWHGLLQPIADGIKLLLKEDFVPAGANRVLYLLAPSIAIITATIGFAVVPFGSTAPGDPDRWQFVVAPGIDIGIVYVFAVSSLGVYAVILGGWASNNKYSFLGGMRASAQIVSYEIPMGMSILGVVLLAKSLNLEWIIDAQADRTWFVFYQPLGFLVFLISAFAETNRAPFDLPECEQELVGGYHTEYSGMKFGMFAFGEYTHVLTVSFLTVILFFGGWDLPWLVRADATGFFAGLAKIVVLAVKVFCVICFMMWVRWTLPRFRFDQLMNLAWKVLIPLALVNLLVTAIVVQIVRHSPESVAASLRQIVHGGWAVATLAGAVGMGYGMWRRRTMAPAAT
jgi:NADH-quinone oxidoreductase subunit H